MVCASWCSLAVAAHQLAAGRMHPCCALPARLQTHYFTSHPKLNHYAIIPKGGEPWWEQPHDRAERFPAAATTKAA